MFCSSKKIREMTAPELQLRETFELIEQLEVTLKRLDYLADSILSKAMLAHSLIVIRKVDENRVDDLNKILD